MTKHRASFGPNERNRSVAGGQSGFRLQERDEDFLVMLFHAGLMARRHLQALFFTSMQRCNARLLQHRKAGLILQSCPDTVLHGGQAVYSLASGAYPIVARKLGMGIEEVRRSCRARRGQQVAHTLGVLDLRIALQTAIMQRHDLRLDLWLSEHEARHEYRLRRDGVVVKRVFKPDAVARLQLGSNRFLTAFIEFDRGHVSARKFAQTVESHSFYMGSSLFPELFGEESTREFYTLVVTTSTQRRLDHLRQVAAAHQATFFRFTTEEDVKRMGFFGPIWLPVDGDEPVTLC